MNKFYPLKQWLATIIIAPLLPALLEGFIPVPISGSILQNFASYPIFVGFGILFSLPVLALFYMTFFYLEKISSNLRFIKTVLTAVAILGIYLSFKIIGGSIAGILTLAYSGAAIFSSFLFRLKPTPRTTDFNQGEIFS